MDGKFGELWVWLLSLAGSLALCGARLSWLLFRVGPLPPAEAEALALWKLKRRWLIASELSALPAFVFFAVMVGKRQHWPVENVVLLSMVLGALGFAFFLDALQTIARRLIAKGSSDA